MPEFRTDFESELSTAPSRFLSKAVQHALAEGWRNPEDFFRHFGPEAIMRALADAHELRAEILIKAANVHEKLARKKSVESASEDLGLALSEGLTDARSVLSLFPPDDCVRYLASSLLWRFLFEEEFWSTTKGSSEHARAVARMTFLLECALEQKLITLSDLMDGLSLDQITASLPPERLRQLLKHAMTIGRSGDALTEAQILEVVPLPQLVGDLPLKLVWEGVVVGRVAAPAGFLDSKGVPPAKPAEAPAAKPAEAPVRPAKPAEAPARAAKPAEASAPAASLPAAKEESTAAAEPASSPKSSPSGSQAAPDNVAVEARQQAVTKLTSLGRLPPSHEDLPTPILLSIESMYDELSTLTSDDDREACIRDSFPNESHLRTALLALIELLDPTIDVHKPPISDAEADALVKVVLFEERQRQEQQGGGAQRRGSMRPPPLPSGRGPGRPGSSSNRR